MTAESRPPVAPAWHELEALAVAMRPDWDPADVQAARIAAEQAWPFDRAARELWRLIWAEDGTPGELVGTIRAERPRPSAGHLDPGARAAALAPHAANAEAFRARDRSGGDDRLRDTWT